MTGYENRISKEVSDLQRRAEQLELRKKARADENNDPAVQEAKRRRRSLSVGPGSDGMGSNARSHASLRRHDDEERHTVVFSGFTAKSHKMLPVDYAKLQLPVVERWADDVFAGFPENFHKKIRYGLCDASARGGGKVGCARRCL